MTQLQTEVWRPVDWTLQGAGSTGDRAFCVALCAEARGPGGERLRVPGFYAGEDRWCVRFSPTVEGEWRLVSISDEPSLAGAECIVAANGGSDVRGPLRVQADDPLHFRAGDGEPHFLMGYECDWLWALDQTASDTPRLRAFLDMLAEAHFNHVMVNSFAYDCRWAEGKTRENDFGPPDLIPWAGTHDAPRYAQLNTAYFDHYDRMMWALYERGLVAHIYMKVYNKMVNWPPRRSREEDLFFDYFVARYQAFPNIVWDFSKECYNEPDKPYVAHRLRRLRELDAYDHLTTVHDDWYFSYNDPFRECIDFLTDQNHQNFYYTILDQRGRGVGPVVNSEYGYEHGPGGMEDKTYGVVQPPLEVLRRTYEVVMAGGYPVYYYTNHAWDVLEWDERPAGLSAYQHLYEFITETSWHVLEPRPDLGVRGLRCLTDGCEELILYSPDGQGVLVAPVEWDGTTWQGECMHIETGEREAIRLDGFEVGRRTDLSDPLGNVPSIAHLHRL